MLNSTDKTSFQPEFEDESNNLIKSYNMSSCRGLGTLGPNLVINLPVTFGLKHVKNTVINIGLVRLLNLQWPKFGHGAAK